MKVLQVHNIAHIPPLIVKSLKKQGVSGAFVEDADSVRISDFDIVHAHYALNRKTIRAFRLARKNKIPFVLHCHGSDVRRVTPKGLTRLPFHYRQISQFIRKRASKVFLATPDLISYAPEGEYLANPVDLDVFRPMPGAPKSDRILIAGTFYAGEDIARFIKPDAGYDCINVKGDYPFPGNVRMLEVVPHERFAAFLNGYPEMLGTFNDLISMTRMEAMACGLKTFTNFDAAYMKHYDGQNPDDAPDPRAFVERFHHPDRCASRLAEVYEDVLKNG